MPLVRHKGTALLSPKQRTNRRKVYALQQDEAFHVEPIKLERKLPVCEGVTVYRACREVLYNQRLWRHHAAVRTADEKVRQE